MASPTQIIDVSSLVENDTNNYSNLGTTLGTEVGGKMDSQERFPQNNPGRFCYLRKSVA